MLRLRSVIVTLVINFSPTNTANMNSLHNRYHFAKKNLQGLGKCKSCSIKMLPCPGSLVPIIEDMTLLYKNNQLN